MQSNNEIIREVNQYAMQNGIVLGLFGIASLAVFKWSFYHPFFSTLFMAMLIGSPVLGAFLTFKYRQASVGTDAPFGFARGFLHALFTGFYASIWVALFTFVYLNYFDHGTLFAAYAQSLDRPEMKQYLEQSGMAAQLDSLSGGEGVQGVARTLQSIGPAVYASLSLYFSMIFGPFIALFIGLITRRG